MTHDHGHSHDHDHGDDHERRAGIAFLITAGFMVVEALGGWFSGSLALIADAGHMLTDAMALGLTWIAFRLGRRGPDTRRTFGYRRVEVLAAWINGLSVVALAVWIVYEAATRLMAPTPVMGWPMMAVAACGLVVNLLVLRILGGHHHGHAHENLNLRGAALHVMGDLLGSVAALGAAGVILWTGWTPIDPILSVVVAFMIVFSGWRLLRATTHILLEGTPDGLDPDELRERLPREVEGLKDIHHLHAWAITGGEPMVTMHATLEDGARAESTLEGIKRALGDSWGVEHSVIQIERGDCPDEDRPGPACDTRDAAPSSG